MFIMRMQLQRLPLILVYPIYHDSNFSLLKFLSYNSQAIKTPMLYTWMSQTYTLNLYTTLDISFYLPMLHTVLSGNTHFLLTVTPQQYKKSHTKSTFLFSPNLSPCTYLWAQVSSTTYPVTNPVPTQSHSHPADLLRRDSAIFDHHVGSSFKGHH